MPTSYGATLHRELEDDHRVLPAAVLVSRPQSGLSQPIFVSSVMKSGTWLLRAILEELTGLTAHEPSIGPGPPAYDDEMLIDIPPGKFFSWHSILNDRSTALLKGAATKNIFLVRNVYDLITSMYNHLLRDPDAAIGRSVGGSDYLTALLPETAISMMIAGFTTTQLTWEGIAPHIRHISSLLRFREEGGDALLLTYEELTQDKAAAIRRIARYLEMAVGEDRVADIVQKTGFESMKNAAQASGTSGHFAGDDSRKLGTFIRPYHVAMVDAVVMREFPHVPERLGKAGIPWLFELKAAPHRGLN